MDYDNIFRTERLAQEMVDRHLGYQELLRRHIDSDPTWQIKRYADAHLGIAEKYLRQTFPLGFDPNPHSRIIDDAINSEARKLAERSASFSLPIGLTEFLPDTDLMARRLSMVSHLQLSQDNDALAAFARTAAISNALEQATTVDAGLLSASNSFAALPMPHLNSIAEQRAFLDAAGLTLPRWPHFRLLSFAEKRRRLREKQKRYAPATHVKKASTLIHKRERVLIEIIDGHMTAAYGEDWAEKRLPLCDCNTLLGRARNRGGSPLEHADYPHYRDIMSYPDHFDEIFYVAFESPAEVVELLDRARELRGRLYHPHEFTPEHLRDLRLVWNTIDVGLMALMDDFEFVV